MWKERVSSRVRDDLLYQPVQCFDTVPTSRSQAVSTTSGFVDGDSGIINYLASRCAGAEDGAYAPLAAIAIRVMRFISGVCR